MEKGSGRAVPLTEADDLPLIFGIDWKAVAPDVNPLLSEKDGKHPAFDPAKNYFDLNGKWMGA